MTRERHQARLATLSFVRCEGHVLLLRHGPGSDRFAGHWNGIGGHVEAGEDILGAARRELCEEAGLRVERLRLAAVVHESGLLGHAYVLFLFAGESTTRRLAPAPGLELAWHPSGELSRLPLVPDLAVLLPRLWEAGDTLFATQTFDGSDRALALHVSGQPAGGPTHEETAWSSTR